MQHEFVRHNERCKECKKRVLELLENEYDEVKENYNLNLSSKLNELEGTCHCISLKKIYTSLQEDRRYKSFVKANHIPNVDFFIPNPGFILEFDESQHFTISRSIALENYPKNLSIGFPRERWIKLCHELNMKDNDPCYRDEQRAWYDTLRDFVPLVLNMKPTVRLFSKDQIWCNLDCDKQEDVDRFKRWLNER